MATAQLETLLRHIRKLAAGRCSPQRTDRQLLDDFSARRDETAFAALVARHGPMVLRVCRRVLNHEQDAEDAFQATFLVLARNSGSIRKLAALAEWLHGVAYRTAMQAKRSAARRRNHEARLRALSPKAVPSPTWDDVQAVLDQEIQRLPEVFRTAFVLCVLEGKSGPEAAAELGVQPGTVSSRLTRARQRLQRQLARRGIELSALLAALSIAESVGEAGVPAVLASTTLRFGLLVAAGEMTTGPIPAPIAALAAGVTRAMFLTKAKIATAILVTASLLTGGAGLLTHKALAGKPAAPQETTAKPPGKDLPQLAAKEETAKRDGKEETPDALAFSGRVLGPDGQPIAGAKLYLTPWWGYHFEPFTSPESVTTGADGRFEFTVPKARYPSQATIVTAAAPNLGVGWVGIRKDDKTSDLTLQLVDDDVPITGEIVDLEGQPVPGATLCVLQVNAAAGEDLGPWLEAAKDKKAPIRDRSLRLEQQYLSRYTTAPSPMVTTDAAGRFRLNGIGRNRLVIAQLEGPTIVSQHLHILTRPGEPIEVPRLEADRNRGTPRITVTYYGSNFRHAAAPTKPIVGVVRDKDTKKPLAGITIQSYKMANSPFHNMFGRNTAQTMTDADGHYRLTGMPKGEGNKILVVPPSDLPYVTVHAVVPDSPGLDPVTVDVELKRGVWIEGKITDKATGKPLQASVEYFAIYPTNPNLGDYVGFDGAILMRGSPAKDDGSYRVAGLPGPGLVAVRGLGDYLRAPEREDEYGVKEQSLSTSPYHISFTSNYSALARIDPAKGVDSVKQDVTLDRGWTFTVTVLGPDGKPLTGARRFALDGMKTAEFTIQAFNPRRPQDIVFQHLDMGLVGVAHPPKENGGPVTVRMEPGASITGRLIDAAGQPRAGVELEVAFRPKAAPHWTVYHPRSLKTDREGRFRIDALLPDWELRLSEGKAELDLGSALRWGQAKDLGDVQMKADEE